MNITLTAFEIEVAQLLAIRRIISSETKQLKSKSLMGNVRPYDSEYVGAACEIAFAKWTGTYPGLTVDTFKAPDVAGMQVRGTRYTTGKLIVRGDDKDSDVFVLVICGEKGFEIKGWVTGGKAKQIGEQKAPNGDALCWMVPANKLYPWRLSDVA